MTKTSSVGADHVKEPWVNEAALAVDAEGKEERTLNIEKTEERANDYPPNGLPLSAGYPPYQTKRKTK